MDHGRSRARRRSRVARAGVRDPHRHRDRAADNPQLTVRAVATPRQPLRIVIDRHAQTPREARVLPAAAPSWSRRAAQRAWPAGVEHVALPDARPGRSAGLMSVLAPAASTKFTWKRVPSSTARCSTPGWSTRSSRTSRPALGDPARGMFSFDAGLPERACARVRIGRSHRRTCASARASCAARETLMFTGIVQTVGRITRGRRAPMAAQLVVDPGRCRSATSRSATRRGARLLPDRRGDRARRAAPCVRRVGRDPALHERPRSPGPVNLEKALRLADRLGGHLMTGHVDGVGTCQRRCAVAARRRAAGGSPSTRPRSSRASSRPRARSRSTASA